MNIPLLEDRLAANPRSPLFARLASLYANEGRFDEAIDLCTAGLKEFPEYPTAHLVLARCFEATGRTVEALIEYRRVLKAVPDNPTVRDLLGRIEKREQEAFRAFAEERLSQLRARRGTMVTQSGTPGKTRVAGSIAEGEEDSHVGAGGEAKIVTVTLAEIYASQGEFDEAIQVYKRLMMEKQDRAAEFTQRIKELEQLARARQAEMRT